MVKIGQYEILEFLKRNPRKWFITKEIAKVLKMSVGSVTACLKRLRKSNFVEFEPVRGNLMRYRYRRTVKD